MLHGGISPQSAKFEKGVYMLRVLSIAVVLILSTTGQGQVLPPEKPKIPQVDVAEVLRRGDLVVVAGEGPRGAVDDAMRMATAPPPDESHMWFVTVIKTKNCQYCTKLHSDFQSAPELLAFVAATSPYKPWGHYNEYDASDETQKWRLKAYRITGYPTIVIQPPRNGMWGNPRTVVMQLTGYDGNPRKLAQQITNGVRAYAAKMGEQGYPKIQDLEFVAPRSTGPETKETSAMATPLWGNMASSEERVKSFPVVVGGARQFTPEPSAPIPTEHHLEPAGRGQFGINPPFAVPPKVDPFNPQPMVQPSPSPNQIPSTYPPTVDPSQIPIPSIATLMGLVIQALGSLFGSQALGNLTLLGILAVTALHYIAPRTKTTLDDDLLKILQGLVPQNPSADSSTKPNQPAQTTSG